MDEFVVMEKCNGAIKQAYCDTGDEEVGRGTKCDEQCANTGWDLWMIKLWVVASAAVSNWLW